MNAHTIELNGNELSLRLTSQDTTKLESMLKKPITEILQDASVTNICRLLRYCVKGGGKPNFSEEDSYKLYDELADAGYGIERIVNELILPTMAVSGILTQSDLDRVRTKTEEIKAQN